MCCAEDNSIPVSFVRRSVIAYLTNSIDADQLRAGDEQHKAERALDVNDAETRAERRAHQRTSEDCARVERQFRRQRANRSEVSEEASDRICQNEDRRAAGRLANVRP